MLVKKLFEFGFLHHMEFAISDVVHVELLNDVPEEAAAGKLKACSVEQVVMLKEAGQWIGNLYTRLLLFENRIEPMGHGECHHGLEIPENLFFQCVPQVNDLFDRVKVDI